MMDRRTFIIGCAVSAASPALAQQSREQVASGLNGQNPAAYYQTAMTLFRAGQRDDATFVFYLGQLRYRTHLAARPDLPPSGDPALFGALSETVGRPINEWAYGDMPAALRILDAVLAYDARDPDRFTPPGQFRAAHDSTREGMRGFRRQMAAQAQDIKRQRAANGLPNRW
jgi:hypothetical protein